MLQLTAKHRIFVGTAPIDFRKGIDGIVALCQRQWQADPRSGHVFVFGNRRGSALKIIVYDGQGYWLCHKRLSSGKFKYWPQHASGGVSLSATQLQVLLSNGDPLGAAIPAPWSTID